MTAPRASSDIERPMSMSPWLAVGPISERLHRAITARADLLREPHVGAFRLFNGFTEGDPTLVLDLYGATLLVHNHAPEPATGTPKIDEAVRVVRERLPWLRAGLLKTRHSDDRRARCGTLLFGDLPDDRVVEDGVCYAIDLSMNRDASLYLDTRNVRRWLRENSAGRSILNTFAYTGSLGVAARAGGAAEVVQLDRNARFLELAQRSCALNGWAPETAGTLVGDFFPKIAQLKRAGRRFDCVIVDPPFFAATKHGSVDLASDSVRLINKVRPLINDGGSLITINNALFVSGRDYHEALQRLCADGYLAIAELIPVPEDVAGYPATRSGEPVTDPAPFNHATKIAVLSVRRKPA